MAQIYNSDLAKELVKGASIQQMRDAVPNQLAEKVVPVMEVNPRLLKVLNFNAASTGINTASTTMFTASTTNDTYITSGTISVIKDATSQSVLESIRGIVNGSTFYFATVASITLTAQTASYSFTLPFPVKIDRGSAVTVVMSNATANCSVGAVIHGYIDYVSNS